MIFGFSTRLPAFFSVSPAHPEAQNPPAVLTTALRKSRRLISILKKSNIIICKTCCWERSVWEMKCQRSCMVSAAVGSGIWYSRGKILKWLPSGSSIWAVFLKKLGDLGENFGCFWGECLFLGLYWRFSAHKRASLVKKWVKNAQKSDEKVRDFVFLFKKIRKYTDFGLYTCAFVRKFRHGIYTA